MRGRAASIYNTMGALAYPPRGQAAHASHHEGAAYPTLLSSPVKMHRSLYDFTKWALGFTAVIQSKQALLRPVHSVAVSSLH